MKPIPVFRTRFFAAFALCISIFHSSGLLAQTREEIKQAFRDRDRFMYSVKCEQQNFIETIPFRSALDEILITVEIGGKPYNFLFDTGAGTVISKELQSQLNLTPVFKNKMVDGAGSEQEEDVVTLDKLKAGNITFDHVGAAVADLSEFENYFCFKLDGIFGTNMMRICSWEIGYKNKTLTFSDKKIKPDFDADDISFIESFSGNPVLKLQMGEYNFQALLDTGKNQTLDIPDSLYFQSRVSKNSKFAKGFGRREITLFNKKPMEEYAGKLDSLYVGHLLFKDIFIRVTPSNMILLGNKFFTNFDKIILDWKRGKLYLPKGGKPLAEDTLTYGFTPQPQNGKIVVVFLWEDSEAKKQGMEIGDVLTAIDGHDVSTISPADWCVLFPTFKKKGTIELTAARGGAEKKYVLKSYDLSER
jgi:hypothetical protein